MLQNRTIANEFYADTLREAEKDNSVLATMNSLGRMDLFFLLTKLLNRKDADQDWLYERCVEVQADPNGHLDLWARDHYKSTIITFAKGIQDILDSHSPDSYWWKMEVTIGIFSHTAAIAKKFLGQIKTELETNTLLQEVYPDILWEHPKREAPVWSLDKGIIVKRKSNPPEATVEAHGLTDGQPTSRHFVILNYDDVVTEESVSTPDQIKKTTKYWELSTNLKRSESGIERYVGTRYHHNDTYKTLIDRKAAKVRLHPATDDGTPEGNPVFLSREALRDKRIKQGPHTFACQQLQNPRAEKSMGFAKEWVKYYNNYNFVHGKEPWPSKWNYYLICDPAGEQKKDNDYTSMAVVALGIDQMYYLVEAVRDRLNLRQRTAKMFEFHEKYHILATGYEKYGKDSDIEHIEFEMELRNYRFDIIPLGGNTLKKNDRIRKLVPPMASGQFKVPHSLPFQDYEGQTQDYIVKFIEEIDDFPLAKHDDILDNLARILDPKLGAKFPKKKSQVRRPKRNNREYKPLEYR